jgi:hypothetical protein
MSTLGPPAGWQPEDVLARIRELEPFRNENIKNQHVVSRVLLKRFARKSGSEGWQLHSFDMKHPERPPKEKGPMGCGVVPNFLRYASQSAEDLWKEVEDRLPPALAAVDDESIVSRPEHLSTIKDTLALHFVRSIQMTTVHEWAWRMTQASLRRQLLSRPDIIEQILRERANIAASGSGAFNIIFDELQSSTQQFVDSGAMLRGRIEHMYAKTREMIDHAGLEIIKVTRGELMIGDVPAVSLKKGHPTVGVLGGVALQGATTVVLPLGRHTCAALARENEVLHVGEDKVEIINRVQLQASHQYVYFNPASGFERFTRLNLKSD